MTSTAARLLQAGQALATSSGRPSASGALSLPADTKAAGPQLVFWPVVGRCP